jgi:hypothetical protein
VRRADVSVDVEDERFAVAVGDVAVLRGGAMPDRACCTMPSNVW